MNSNEELESQVDVAMWEWLKPHQERGSLIVVADGLSLPVVGERLAADDTAVVSSWLAAGQLGRPSADQCACWDKDPTRRFAMLVISPYILIQPID
jgi:hypothetical protein